MVQCDKRYYTLVDYDAIVIIYVLTIDLLYTN
jgi:hypothetical protein